MNWRRTFGAHLRHMTPEQASASLRRIQLRIGIAEQPEVLRLTGLDVEGVTPWVITEVCEKLSEHSRIPRQPIVRAQDGEQVD